MGNSTNETNWAARERLRAVESRLWWRGYVGRKELMTVFGISAAQATSDLQKYFELNEGACVYSTNRKRYESGAGMACQLQEPLLEEGLQIALGEMAGERWQRDRVYAGPQAKRLAAVSLPLRASDPRVDRMVVLAAAQGRKLRVKYASVSSGKSRWREILPMNFGWDGRRWHARAYCLENEGWRDFVMGRIEEAEWPGEVMTIDGESIPADEDWETWEVVKLQVNPELDEARRRAIRMDYGIDEDALEIRVRRAMRAYLLAEMFLVDEAGLSLPRHFVI